MTHFKEYGTNQLAKWDVKSTFWMAQSKNGLLCRNVIYASAN